MEQAYLLYYKTKDGEWKAIPYGILDMYTAYTAYCNKEGKEPVDESTYYDTIGRIPDLITELNTAIENVGGVYTTIQQLGDNALPTKSGGTGQSCEDFAELANRIGSALTGDDSFKNYFATNQNVNSVEDILYTKLNANKIASGKDDPDSGASSEATIYFQYKD